MARGVGREGDYSREEIILNIFVKGDDYSGEVINRGKAVIRGNTASPLDSELAFCPNYCII